MSDFESFWSTYPRKDGKGKARDAYLLAVRKTPADLIMAGLVKHLPGWQQKERQFIPMPATWLNQERWEDEPGLDHEIRMMNTKPRNTVPLDVLPQITPEDRAASLEIIRETQHRLARMGAGEVST